MPAGAVSIQVIVRRNPAGTKADHLAERLADLGPWLTAAKGIAREAIQDEFLRSVWRSPQGEEPWAPHVEHDQYFSHPQLIVSGGLLAAWMGTGSGAIDKRDDTSFTIGVSGHPAAEIHRGGTTAAAAVRSARDKATLIFVTDKMRWFLGLVLGMWLKKTTTHIRIPARPHATPDMATREAMRDALGAYLVNDAAAFGARAVGRAA